MWVSQQVILTNGVGGFLPKLNLYIYGKPIISGKPIIGIFSAVTPKNIGANSVGAQEPCAKKGFELAEIIWPGL